MRYHHPPRCTNGPKVAEQFTVPLPTSIRSTLTDASIRSYGVSRVYSQQYGYILSDAQVAQSNIRALVKAVRTSELDPNAGKAR